MFMTPTTVVLSTFSNNYSQKLLLYFPFNLKDYALIELSVFPFYFYFLRLLDVLKAQDGLLVIMMECDHGYYLK